MRGILRWPDRGIAISDFGVVRSLRMVNFRCFETLDVAVSAAGVILVGDNAQGKTSILEALCVLLRLHSPRTSRMGTLGRMGCGGFGVAGDPWGIERRVDYGRQGWQLKVGGEMRASQTEYLGDGGLLVWMGNEDLELIRGPGEARRRYLDFVGSQVDPHYRRSWSRYRRALQAKNLLLKAGGGREGELLAYEEIMAEHGHVLMEVRAAIVAELAPHAMAAQQAIGGSGENLALQYLPASGPDLLDSIRQARERELRMRQAVVGPHRDDLGLRLHGMPAADYASEGQQRTLALALKLAQGKVLELRSGRPPIYLMDDIFGELDPSRRNAVMASLPPHAQKWITCTHLDWLVPGVESLPKAKVAAGKCTPL